MQTFATPAPITAILAIPAGRIQVTATDQDHTTVQIRPADPGKSRDVKLAGQVAAGYSDGTLRITAPPRHRILGSTGAVEVEIQLPAGSGVHATAASAQLTAEGPLGDLTFDSSQATVTVDEAATARLSTVDGDIIVGRMGGDAEIRTVKGDIVVHVNPVDMAGRTGCYALEAKTGKGGLRPALAELRAFFKKQEESVDADEYVGLLASAEKAAGEKDEGKMLGYLKQIPSKAWEIGKAVVPQVLLHYLKLRGMA